MAETGKRKSYVLFCFHTAGKRLVTHNCCWRQDQSCFSWWLPSWFLGLHHPHLGEFFLGRNIWQALGTGSEGPDQNRFVELAQSHRPIKGTPLYMAPDCFFNGGPADPQGRSVGPWVPLCEKSLEDTCRPFASSHTAFCYNLKPASL